MKTSYTMTLDLGQLSLKKLHGLRDDVLHAIKVKEIEFSQAEGDTEGFVKQKIILGGKLEAIFAYRDLKSCDLVEAKNYVDYVADKMDAGKKEPKP